jgi:hypothetical protein
MRVSALGPAHHAAFIAEVVLSRFAFIEKISVTQANDDASTIDGHTRRLAAELFPLVVLLKIVSTLCGRSPFYLLSHGLAPFEVALSSTTCRRCLCAVAPTDLCRAPMRGERALR